MELIRLRVFLVYDNSLARMGAFDLTIRGLLLGFFINLYLYGFVLNQYLTYKTTKFDDPMWLRILVAALFVVDTSQTAVELYAVWYFLIENYTNPSVLNYVIWMLPFCCVTTAISALIVQIFLINRLYRLTRQFWLYVLLTSAAVVACLCGTVACIWCGIIFDATKLAPVIPLAIAWLAIVASVDIAITVTLSRALWRCKTGLSRTNTIINRCIKASIQSGLFSSVIAIANLAGFVFWNNTYINLIFGWPSGRIYSNSLLYTLVVRKELADIANGMTDGLSTGSFSFSVSPQISSIRIQREVVSGSKVIDNSDRYIFFPPPKDIVTI
ncbi:hypothetical protein DL96DRAFT_1534396 [Flagelloscypha sp. PMI_526]|nr:hypothetical protein DL96DRAFT_1534396 [Flagelloscypha sp. PMI_526]